jgi:hypothetical protein
VCWLLQCCLGGCLFPAQTGSLKWSQLEGCRPYSCIARTCHEIKACWQVPGRDSIPHHCVGLRCTMTVPRNRTVQHCSALCCTVLYLDLRHQFDIHPPFISQHYELAILLSSCTQVCLALTSWQCMTTRLRRTRPSASWAQDSVRSSWCSWQTC